ncbi:MAG: sulfite exporter TauE/SafE family protein, partial [Gammaproteobacteria bacterium]
MLILATLFALTAILYASVGFGGGSAYNAIMVLADTDFRMLPSIALGCNLIVVSGGTLRYARAGLLKRDLVLPFVILSIPMAWLGGQLSVDRTTFTLLLGLSLLLVGAVLLGRQKDTQQHPEFSSLKLWYTGMPVGATLGLLAGIVGIGGGIFLAPFMHLFRFADTRTIAATASFFILVNSIAGLAGHTTRAGGLAHIQALWEYAPLFLAVLVGGQIGSHLGNAVFSPRTVRRMTAALVIYVSLR